MEGLADVFRCMRSLAAVAAGLGGGGEAPVCHPEAQGWLSCRAQCPYGRTLLCSLVLQQRDAKTANVHLKGELWRQGRRKGKAQSV